jgi:hypothetical protein
MFTREQRNNLEQASLICFGVRSKWHTLYNKGHLNIDHEKPGYDRLYAGLLEAAQTRIMRSMSPADLCSVAAYSFLSQESTAGIKLHLAESEVDKEEFAKALEKLPEAKAAQLREMVSEDGTMGALQFAFECIYIHSLGESAKDGILGIFAEYETKLLNALERNNLRRA